MRADLLRDLSTCHARAGIPPCWLCMPVKAGSVTRGAAVTYLHCLKPVLIAQAAPSGGKATERLSIGTLDQSACTVENGGACIPLQRRLLVELHNRIWSVEALVVLHNRIWSVEALVA